MPSLRVPPETEPTRLDAWLSRHSPECSRARWQTLIQEGAVRVDGRCCKPRKMLTGGERIDYEIPPAIDASLQPEAIALRVLFEDADLIVVDKPAGLVVHPAPGHAGGTLVNALLHHCHDLGGIGGERRPGIVHRLDKDTSGLLVVAKNEAALRALQHQFKQRCVRKEYAALVWGAIRPPAGTIDLAIRRHAQHRTRMAAVASGGRHALTHYEVVRAFAEISQVRLRIETGRTHQIRVHMAHLGHPVVGDALYGGVRRHHAVQAPRQMLHAAHLEFEHPRSREKLSFDAPLPPDFCALLRQIESA